MYNSHSFSLFESLLELAQALLQASIGQQDLDNRSELRVDRRTGLQLTNKASTRRRHRGRFIAGLLLCISRDSI